jgi:4-amino-4-deoxy-L-arabinose transferase-like glycosyltransferase
MATVWGLSPYCHHVDEAFLTRHAADILQNGDLNPHFFKYPSFPIYLTAVTMKLSSFVVGPSSPAEWTVPVLLGAPYAPASIYVGPRLVFALLSIAAAAGVGVLAWRLYRDELALFLAPLVLVTSNVFQHSAVNYLNVDIVTLGFVMATLTVVFVTWDQDTYLAQAILPGLLSGVAVASKYNSGLVLLPAALRVLFVSKDRVRRLAVLGLCAAAAFLVFVPYSILDHASFVRDVKWEIRHYRTGHLHYEADPGLPQLRYYLSSLASDLGGVTMGLAVVGLIFGLVVQPKRTATLASLPVAMLLHMSTNRVHFLRTVLPAFAVATVFAAGGIVGIAAAARRAAERFAPPKWRPSPERVLLWSRVLAVGAVAAYLPTLRHTTLFDRNIGADSRNVVSRWLRAHAAGAPIVVPPEAFISPDALRALNARQTERGMDDLAGVLAEGAPRPCYVVTPRYAGSKAARSNGERVLGVLKEKGAAEVLTVEGNPLALPPARGKMTPVFSPTLAVHRVTCGGGR